jgi:hypothetical protein
MNVRKLLDWRKLLIYSHRWMGIAFGPVFVSWFVSGIAFMYWGMPQVSREERLERQDPIDLSGAVLEPAGIAESRGIGVSSLAIEMRDGRPVFRIGPTPVFADAGESVPEASRSDSLPRRLTDSTTTRRPPAAFRSSQGARMPAFGCGAGRHRTR